MHQKVNVLSIRLTAPRRSPSARLTPLLALIALLVAAPALSAQDCSFELGFKAVRDLIPNVVGECLENEHHNPNTGLTQQATANGRLIWRKADNWTGFTDGRHTWENGPDGLQRRSGDEIFARETPASDQVVRRLTLNQLRNAEFHLPLLGAEDTSIRLENGEASIASESEPRIREYAGMVAGAVAYGDLNADGYADAVVAAFTSGGGSGTFIHLVVFLDRDGTPAQAARFYLGDRVRVNRLATAGSEIIAETVSHRPGDGLCCPSLAMSRSFVFSEYQLVPRQALVVDAPLPGQLIESGEQVRGTAITTPDSETLNYLVYDARGGVIGRGSIPLPAGYGAAYPATFSAPIEFLAARNGPGRIKILSTNGAGTDVAVTLQAAPLTDGRINREPVSQLVLESPASGALVFGTLELRGRISSLPFEKNLTYRIYDSAGAVVDESYISVVGEYGGPGTFAKSIELPAVDNPGTHRVEVREESAVDGALIVSTSVEVQFAGV
jgi:hypothetical protein